LLTLEAEGKLDVTEKVVEPNIDELTNEAPPIAPGVGTVDMVDDEGNNIGAIVDALSLVALTVIVLPNGVPNPPPIKPSGAVCIVGVDVVVVIPNANVPMEEVTLLLLPNTVGVTPNVDEDDEEPNGFPVGFIEVIVLGNDVFRVSPPNITDDAIPSLSPSVRDLRCYKL
jgi:hypothetical protein